MAGIERPVRRLCLTLVFFIAAPLAAKSSEVILGEKAYSKGSYDSALYHFRQAIENGDESGEPRLYIGLILEARRQYAESLPYFKAASERTLSKKFRKVAYWKLVILYRQAKLYPESLRYVALLEDIGEKSELFEKIRVEAENHQGRQDFKGYAHVQKARNLEATYLEKSAKGEDADDLAELINSIIGAYKQALAEDARWSDCRWKIAHYQEKLKQPKEAQATYKQIWDETQDPNAAYKLGYYARRAGDYSGALQFFAAALEKGIDDPQLRFYVRLNAAQAHYALSHHKEAFIHATAAKRLAEELELKKKVQHSLKRTYCLSAYSMGEAPGDDCRFSKKEESTPFRNLIGMKRALAEKDNKKAAELAAQIYEKESVDSEDNENSIPGYAMSDLPVAIGVLFKEEKYRAVLQLTEQFRKYLEKSHDLSSWRGVSHFALKEYGSALVEFDKLKNPTPSQMNLHLMSMAHLGDWAGLKQKAERYMKNPKARLKIETNLRQMRLYEPLRREADFETWLRGASSVTP